ncbi:MAG: hypothetical protein R2794_06725 [Chitinophagales bacterium]
MGLFDFLKKKEKAQTTSRTESFQFTETEPYLGDLNKTNVLYKLVQTARNERDEKWRQTFLDNIGQASFRCGDPQVKTGPDGFPYFKLFLPEANKEFQCFVIDKMKDDFLLASGFGVVINPTPDGADWVLSYGDILNFHLNKTFYTTTETAFSRETNNEVINANEEVLIAQPSEILLPKQTRNLLAEFLKRNGIHAPKILLLVRPGSDGNGVSQDLVFNLTPNNFTDENTYNRVMQIISWYLPRHYSFVGMDEKSFKNEFRPL